MTDDTVSMVEVYTRLAEEANKFDTIEEGRQYLHSIFKRFMLNSIYAHPEEGMQVDISPLYISKDIFDQMFPLKKEDDMTLDRKECKTTVTKGPTLHVKNSGRTSKQMLEAPQNSYYVWGSRCLDYPRKLAKHLGRSDLRIVGKKWLSYSTQPDDFMSHTIMDHAVPIRNCIQDMKLVQLVERIKSEFPEFEDNIAPSWFQDLLDASQEPMGRLEIRLKFDGVEVQSTLDDFDPSAALLDAGNHGTRLDAVINTLLFSLQ